MSTTFERNRSKARFIMLAFSLLEIAAVASISMSDSRLDSIRRWSYHFYIMLLTILPILLNMAANKIGQSNESGQPYKSLRQAKIPAIIVMLVSVLLCCMIAVTATFFRVFWPWAVFVGQVIFAVWFSRTWLLR